MFFWINIWLALQVKNVNPCVTNELLFKAFSTFGQVETAKVIPNSNNYSGNKLCEGIVVFSNQSYAKEAVAVCNEYPFVLTASIIPVIVEPYEVKYGYICLFRGACYIDIYSAQE